MQMPQPGKQQFQDVVIHFIDDIDPNNWWDATNYKFQPTITGYYLIHAAVWWSQANGNGQINIQIRKNGNQLAIYQQHLNTDSGASQTISKIVYLNGSTDYITVSAYSSANGQTTNIQAASGNGTYFYAILQ
jgi:hypothetical protein